MSDPPRNSGNLSAELTSFVGRRAELSEAKRMLTGSRLVTLTGMGGVGKTRLALRTDTGLRRAFPDGVWFVRLAELTDPALLPSAISAELGLHDGMSALAQYVEDKRLLLILDNCEHLVDACAVLVDKLLSSTPGVRILVTSRQILRADGEQVLVVPPLPLPAGPHEPRHGEAVTLFADRAAAVLPGFAIDVGNRELVTHICRRLDGVPLAIELAAVRLRVLSLEQILYRLDDRFRLLTTGNRTALPRQQTLEATIAWSFELCTPQEKAVWAATSGLAGGFDLEAAEAVCGGEALDLVAALVDKSILIRRDGTYGPQFLVPDAGERARVRRPQARRVRAGRDGAPAARRPRRAAGPAVRKGILRPAAAGVDRAAAARAGERARGTGTLPDPRRKCRSGKGNRGGSAGLLVRRRVRGRGPPVAGLGTGAGQRAHARAGTSARSLPVHRLAER